MEHDMIATIFTRWIALRARNEARNYRIGRGVAVSLPHEAGVLRIVEGEVWLTCEHGAHSGVDHVLGRGQGIALEADAQAVFECARSDRPVRAIWDPMPRDNRRGPLRAAAELRPNAR
jgi:hypothetical protein